MDTVETVTNPRSMKATNQELRPYRCGVIGLGFAGMGYLEILSAYPDLCEVISVCDLRIDSIFSKNHFGPEIQIYSGYRRMLDREKFDCLIVATYADSHCEIVCRAARASGVKLIVCEKPMATSVLDCQQMIEECDRHHVRLAINHSFRYLPQLQKIQAELASGDWGKPVQANWSQGGGRLGCMGSHFFDAMRWFLGSDPVWITGFLDPVIRPNPRGSKFKDPGGFGIACFSSGARGFIDLSEDLSTPSLFNVLCEHGRISVEVTENRYEVFARRKENRIEGRYNYLEPLERVEMPLNKETWLGIGVIREIESHIEGKPPICTAEDGKWAVEMVVAMHVSHSNGNTRVCFPLSKRDRATRYSFT